MLHSLREKHPILRYRSFTCLQDRGHLRCKFEIVLEPEFVFYPEISFEVSQPVDQTKIANLVFHLGMIELISYWKAACPAQIIIEAGRLSEEQLAWWHDLYLHGLGEFFFRNEIDFTVPGFLTLSCSDDAESFEPQRFETNVGALILTAGGKDSAVSLELLANANIPKTTLVLNPTRASLDAARIAGYTNPAIVRRSIDPLLLKLNAAGYLNGHTPFSAYLAFCSVLSAATFGYRDCIVSNERSSSEPNTYFHDYPINHQYSKSFRFEQRFQTYCAKYLSPDLYYFSFLRPLYDIQVAALFAQFPRHFSSFRSCNVLQQSDAWCGNCPKCAFVYLALFPFVGTAMLNDIFGRDLFAVPAIQKHIRGLVGLENQKPFECVGTHDESRLAIELSLEKLRRRNTPVPPFLESLHQELTTANLGTTHTRDSFTNLAKEHALPPSYAELLQSIVEERLSTELWEFDGVDDIVERVDG